MNIKLYFRALMTVCAFIFLLLNQPLILAATAPVEVRDAVYDMETVSPYKAYFQNQNEYIDMETGCLNLRVTDLTLPGRGGLDFNLTRVYSSFNAAWFTPSYKYNESNNIVAYTKDSTYLDKKYGLGVGWAFDFPSLESTDNGTYLHFGGGVYRLINDPPSNLEKYYLQDIVFDFNGGVVDGLSYQSSLKTKGGLNYYFDSSARLFLIRNRVGDKIRFFYTTPGAPLRISKVIDSVGREIFFTYEGNKVIVSVNGKVIEYNIVQVFDGTVDGVHSHKYVLDSVIYKSIGGAEPGDRIIRYGYKKVTGEFRFVNVQNSGCSSYYAYNTFSLLTQITHPGGAFTSYAFEFYQRYDIPMTPGIYCVPGRYRLFRRSDTVNNQESQINEFAYPYTDKVGSYNQRKYIPAAWDTQSQAKGLTERYYYKDHLLVRKESQGEGFHQKENTYYNSYTKRPYCQEIVQFNPSTGDSGVPTRKYVEYDIYGNLLAETVETTENGAKTKWSETINFYDQAHYHVLKESRQTIDSQTALITSRNIDAYGRIALETKSIAQKSGVQNTSCASPNGPVLYYPPGQSWRWITPIKVNRISLKVYWFAAAPWQYANYSIQIWSYNEEDPVVSKNHQGQGGMFVSSSHVDTWSFDLPENAYYILEIKTGTMGHFGSCVQARDIQGVGTEDLYTGIESSTTSYQYDPVYLANLTKETTGKYITNYEYDSVYHAYPKRIYVSNVNNPGFGVTGETVQVEYDYDSFGRGKTFKKGSVHQTYLYDNWDRVIEEKYVTTGLKKTINYYDSQNKVEVIDENNQKSIYRYDGLSRLSGTFGVLNNSEVKLSGKVYNSLGQPWQDIDGDNHITYYYYDAGGRPSRTLYPDGNSQYTSFDDYNRKKIVRDTNNIETIIVFDPLGKNLKVLRGSQTLAEFGYDQLGRVIRSTDGNGQIIRYIQGLYGVKEELYRKADDSQSQLSNIKYEYDPLGNVTKKWWKSNVANSAYDRYISYNYDEAGRLINKTYSGSSSYVKYRYDPASNVKDAVNHYAGDGVYEVATTYNYTGQNRLDNYTQNINGRTYTVDYNYLNNGLLDNITYPGTGTKIIYGYDTLGRVSTVRNNSVYYIGSAAAPGVTYRNTGFISKFEFGNGMVENFMPDNQNRIDLLKLYHRDTPNTLLLNLDYNYDGEGNIRSTGKDAFTYDNQNRLKTATVNDTATTYQLDSMGNRQRVTSTNGKSQTYSPATDHNLLTSITDIGSLSYDTAGNLVSKNNVNNNTIYLYDEENHLRKVVKNGVTIATYWYDAAGNRVQTTRAGETIQYVYHGLNVIQEINLTTGVTSDSIYLGKIKFAEKKNGELNYLHWDHLGSTRMVTNESGKIVDTLEYDAFGALKNTTNYNFNTGLSQPEEWQYEEWSGDSTRSRGTYSPNEGLSNSKCVKLETLANEADAVWELKDSSTLTVAGDRGYQVTGSYKCLNPLTVGARVTVITYDATGAQVDSFTSPQLANAMNWITFSFSIHTGPNAVKLRLVVRLSGAAGQGVLFDNVNLLTAAVSANYNYTGKAMDGTGLLYFGARWYDPEIGRFITQDPARNGLNWFSYCNGNPINLIDPDGRYATLAVAFMYALAIGSSPDSVMDVQMLAMDLGNGDWLGAGLDVVSLMAPGVTNLRGLKVIGEYAELNKSWKGLKQGVVEIHHLIEKRFAKLLGVSSDKILSVAIDKLTHGQITAEFRKKIGYLGDRLSTIRTFTATLQDLWNALRDVYKDDTEILDILWDTYFKGKGGVTR
jgi:RHS repeat-associated protein